MFLLTLKDTIHKSLGLMNHLFKSLGLTYLLQVVVRNVPHITGFSVSDSVDNFFQTNHPNHYIGHQAVYNANKYARLVRKSDKLHNWLDYYQLKSERHPDKKLTIRTGFCGLWGRKVDAVGTHPWAYASSEDSHCKV
ncbi:hypothetical protein RIF29_29967 [Crotalaria pallida]|uniref:CSC1/OSCA1-like cytosolic domain-containing protein n=1 Tax=Crotalaria pallida TaxID=3830 RepID=A0AAN9EHU1_CROPI